MNNDDFTTKDLIIIAILVICVAIVILGIAELIYINYLTIYE